MKLRDWVEAGALATFAVGVWLKDPASVPLIIGGAVLVLSLLGRLRGRT